MQGCSSGCRQICRAAAADGSQISSAAPSLAAAPEVSPALAAPPARPDPPATTLGMGPGSEPERQTLTYSHSGSRGSSFERVFHR